MEGISSRDKEVIVPHSSVLLKPHLEHWLHFWSLLYKKDVDRLECVQREARRMIRGLPALKSNSISQQITSESYGDFFCLGL